VSIRHIVLWKLAAEDADTRALHAEQISERLRTLPPVISEIRQLEIGTNVAYPAKNWDMALAIDFADIDALERYQVHPAHQEVVAFVSPLIAERASVDHPI
jgi:hypothetical protein